MRKSIMVSGADYERLERTKAYLERWTGRKQSWGEFLIFATATNRPVIVRVRAEKWDEEIKEWDQK